MSVHIRAQKGQIAPTVLLPGDPLRAKFVAENYLQDAKLFNDVRGMLGYTGTYRGESVSVMGTGMGMPSHSIYVHELIHEFGARKLVRIGSCGAIQDKINVRDLIIAMSASTDSALNRERFQGMGYAPTADYQLLRQAVQKTEQLNSSEGYMSRESAAAPALHVGSILSSDWFYTENADFWQLWARYGTLAIEMETAALYTLAARAGVQALSLLTVSDHIVRGEALSSDERERSFSYMMEVALSLV